MIQLCDKYDLCIFVPNEQILQQLCYGRSECFAKVLLLFLSGCDWRADSRGLVRAAVVDGDGVSSPPSCAVCCYYHAFWR